MFVPQRGMGRAWNNIVQFHGSPGGVYGGMEDVHILGNFGQTFAAQSGPIGGAYGLLSGSNSTAPMTDIWIDQNSNFEGGTAANAFETGIFLGTADYVYFGINRLDNEWFGVYADSATGIGTHLFNVFQQTLTNVGDDAYLMQEWKWFGSHTTAGEWGCSCW